MELTILIIYFTLAILVIFIILVASVFIRALNCQNEYKFPEEPLQKVTIMRSSQLDNSVFLEKVRNDSTYPSLSLQLLNVESLKRVKDEGVFDESADSSLLRSLGILHVGNLNASKNFRSYSEDCFHILSNTFPDDFNDDIHHHLSSTRKNPFCISSKMIKSNSRNLSPFEDNSMDLQCSFVKEFEADLNARFCSTRRSSKS